MEGLVTAMLDGLEMIAALQFVLQLPHALVKEHAMLMKGLVTAMLDGKEMIATLQLVNS